MSLLDRLRPASSGRVEFANGGVIYPTPSDHFLDELNFPLTKQLAEFLGLKDPIVDQNGNPYNVLTMSWGSVILESQTWEDGKGIVTHGFYRAVPSHQIENLHEILRVMAEAYHVGCHNTWKRARARAREVLAEAAERI
jgi:hypothetical protein